MKEKTVFCPVCEYTVKYSKMYRYTDDADRMHFDCYDCGSELLPPVKVYADPCPHLRVEIHSRLYAAATRYEPAEYEQKAHCIDCGDWFDVEAVAEEAQVTLV